jgi:NADPH:quinone reductase-like Zn-dependent oxidoreductase
MAIFFPDLCRMRALLLEAFNTPYRLVELPKPVAGPRQVLVRIAASAINPLDLKIMVGLAGHAQTKLPAILGIDMAGTVEAVGEGVTGFRPGDEVYGMTGGIAGVPGSLAEYAAVDPQLLALKPKNLSMRQAAALPLVLITAWEGLVDRAQVGSGKTVLIHGGAGGVGHIAVQLAVARGAQVFATVTPGRNELIEGYGAIPIDYTRLSVEEYMLEYTGGEGFDIVLDTVGGAVLDASFKAAKRYTGHVVSILGWGTHSLAPLSFRGATYSGVFTLYPLISGKARAHHGEILREASHLAEAGLLLPLLDNRHFRLDTIAEAYDAMNSRGVAGKLVVDVHK